MVTIYGVAVNSNLGRHFESPVVMGRPRFRPLRASTRLISVMINRAVNSNLKCSSMEEVMETHMEPKKFGQVIGDGL